MSVILGIHHPPQLGGDYFENPCLTLHVGRFSECSANERRQMTRSDRRSQTDDDQTLQYSRGRVSRRQSSHQSPLVEGVNPVLNENTIFGHNSIYLASQSSFRMYSSIDITAPSPVFARPTGDCLDSVRRRASPVPPFEKILYTTNWGDISDARYCTPRM